MRNQTHPLSPKQETMLAQLHRLSPGHTLSPALGRAAAGWWRTAHSLADRGLCVQGHYIIRATGIEAAK